MGCAAPLMKRIVKSAVERTVLIFVLCLVLATIGVPLVLGGRALIWYTFWGPPLDLDAPQNGRLVAHVDWFAASPGEVARIRITDVDHGVVIWDVESVSGRSECWNGCWNLMFQAGENPTSFQAGRQQFRARLPQPSTSFLLVRGIHYKMEVWDTKGRVMAERFVL